MIDRWWTAAALVGFIAACHDAPHGRRPDPGDSRPTAGGAPGGAPVGAPTGTAVDTWELAFTADPERPEPDAGAHHHASVAWADGWWVGYQHDLTNRLRRATGSGWELVHDGAPVPFSHPQLDGGDAVVAVSHLAAGGVVGVSWANDGAPLAEPVWFDLVLGMYPDVATDADRGVAVWSALSDLGCARFGAALADAGPTACPARLDAGRSVGTVSVDLGPTGGWLAWSEAAVGTPATVALAAFDPDQAGVAAAMATVIDPSWDARPDVAITDTGGLLTWRGATGPTLPPSAWLQAFTAPDDAREPRRLGGAGADRPVVAAAHPVGVVAWEEAGVVRLELVDAADGAPLTAPIAASPPDVGGAGRPAVAIAPEGDGWSGLVAWEVAPDGYEAPTEVWVRRFTVTRELAAGR